MKDMKNTSVHRTFLRKLKAHVWRLWREYSIKVNQNSRYIKLDLIWNHQSHGIYKYEFLEIFLHQLLYDLKLSYHTLLDFPFTTFSFLQYCLLYFCSGHREYLLIYEMLHMCALYSRKLAEFGAISYNQTS